MNLDVKESSDSVYADVVSGEINVFSINADLSGGNKKRVSQIGYKGRVMVESGDSTFSIPTTRIYYDDNMLNSTKFPFYNISSKVEEYDEYVNEVFEGGESVVSVMRAKTENDNVDIYLKFNEDKIEGDEEISYSYEIK